MVRQVFKAFGSLLFGVALTTAFHAEECPPCENLFLALEAGADGRLSQHIKMEERGESESGTGMMGMWAKAALESTCDFLGSTYGRETCDITRSPQGMYLEFKPQVARNDSPCSCGSIDRVSVSLDTRYKHELPVEETCPWWHVNSISAGDDACRPLDGTPIRNFLDLRSCVEETECNLTDPRLQFVPLRDPRAMTVGAYFHRKKHHPSIMGNTTVDEFVLSNLALSCQWVALRHIIFEGRLASSSEIFWYEDATADPVGWHLRWTRFAGLQLPATLVEAMAQANEQLAQDHIDQQIGRRESTATRTWKDEVGEDVVDGADEIVRLWLPPVLLARLGIV